MALLNVSAKGGYWEQYNFSNLDLDNDHPIKRRIANMLDVNGMRAYRKLMATLNGAAVGGTALLSHRRILARENVNGELGGLRTIQTVVDINRVTTAADKTDIDQKILDFPSEPAPYPPNGDGNTRQFPGG